MGPPSEVTSSTEHDVRSAQSGDRKAFGRLVARYQGMVLRYARAWLRDEDAARDAAQETFIEAFTRLHQLREGAAFPGWLRRIALKQCDRRTRGFRLKRGEAGELPMDPPQVHALEVSQRRAEVREAIEALPPHERIVVALHYLGEEAQPEVAAFLELSLDTVKKRLSRARRRLEATLGQIEEVVTTEPTEAFADPIHLFLALRAGDQEAVGAVLDRRPELLEAPEQWTAEEALAGGFPLAHRATPLVLAVSRGDEPMVEALLARGATVDATCDCEARETPLMAAVVHGRQGVVRRLLEAQADPHQADRRGVEPLHVAALRGDRSLMALLQSFGADPGRPDPEGRTAEALFEEHRRRDRSAGEPPRRDRPGREPAPVRPEAGAPGAEASGTEGSEPGADVLPRASSSAAQRVDQGEPLETGIKAVDLFAPLERGMLVRVHGRAETGLMVLVGELSHALRRSGLDLVWASWLPRPWFKGELDTIAARSGLSPRVETAGLDALLGAADLSQSVVVVFAQEGLEAEVEARLPRLRAEAALTLVVDPWLPATRNELEPPVLAPPFDAVIVTDPALAEAGIFPAIDMQRTASRRARALRHRRVEEATRRRHDDGRTRAFLSQPFFTCAHETGMLGVRVDLKDTLTGFEGVTAGRFEHVPPNELGYRGAL